MSLVAVGIVFIVGTVRGGAGLSTSPPPSRAETVGMQSGEDCRGEIAGEMHSGL